VTLSLDLLARHGEKVLVDPEWIIAFVGDGVSTLTATGLDDAQMYVRREQLDPAEIVYLTAETAAARGWLPPEADVR
jgi:hypothetical protein